MKQILMIVGFFLLFMIVVQPTHAQRFAECDACGYCINREAPETWNACAQCLYSDLGVIDTTTPTENRTLTVILTPVPDPNNPNNFLVNRAYPPARGKYYTQLGCLDVGLNSFADPSAAGGVLNFLLTRLLFPVAGILAFVGLIYGAFLLITAQENYEQIGRGKAWVYGSIIGIVFTLSSIFLVQIIGANILRIPGLSATADMTFVARGTAVSENGKEKYPELTVYLDSKPVTVLSDIKNEAKPLQISLSETLDFSNPTDLSRLSFAMTNDNCYQRDPARNVCCSNPARSNSPQCQDPTHFFGDINLFISEFNLGKKKCVKVQTNTGIHDLQTSTLAIYGSTPFQCIEVL